MLDKIILGILSLKEMTVYDLKKSLDKSINHFYTTSYGSIHPALVKLSNNQYVKYSDFVEKGRSKKLYSITDEGRNVFQKWLESDIEVSRLKEDSLVKIFFFGMLETSSRERIISNYLEEIDSAMKQLQQLRETILEKNIPDEFSELARFQTETLNYGIDQSHFMKKWFLDFLDKPKGENK